MIATINSKKKNMLTNHLIPVAAPVLKGNEAKYVLDCLNSSWISSNGKYIQQFETAFAEYIGVKHGISCCNGTVALHLALLALGVGPGDEVIVPTLTYVATANAVKYCGAKPVFVDSEDQTWNLSPELLEGLITAHTKGIIAVHLYGHPANMDPILSIAHKHSLFVIEDAAEAHGALYKGQKVGSLGDISTFSFYGNKIITTGEGGMVCVQDDRLASIIQQLKGQGQDIQRRFWFTMVGYNYRMTNIEAAIGLAQLEEIDWHISRRREVATWYRSALESIKGLEFSSQQDWAESVFWMSSLVLDEQYSRDAVITKMLEQGVETRPFFPPMHTLPIYLDQSTGEKFPVAERLGKQGINLPSSALLSKDQIKYVVDSLVAALHTTGK